MKRIEVTFRDQLAEAVNVNALRLGETVQSFVVASVRQRLRFFDVGLDPKTGGLRAMQAIFGRWSKQEVNRLLDTRSLAENVCGNDLHDRLGEIAKSAGMSVEELLILTMRQRLLDAGITIDADWAIQGAANIAVLSVASRDAKGGSR